MAYQVISHELGTQPISEISETANHPVGHKVKAIDPAYGEGEFVYLKGVASTAVGSVVTYNPYTGATTLAVASARGPVAVAMSANVESDEYGWYQVSGVGSAVSGTVADNKPAFLTATPGTIDDAVVTGDLIVGMTTLASDSGGKVLVTLQNPVVVGTNVSG